MELLAWGDSYIWYCDWCDTKNVTPWVRAKGNEVCCAACHKNFATKGTERPTQATVAQSPLRLHC